MTGMFRRRQMMQGAAAVLTTMSYGGTPARAKTPIAAIGESTMDTSYAPTGKGIVTGKGVGDFDFLAGNWHIRHKRLKGGTKDEWQRFESSATVHRVLDGMGSIEELRKADGSFMGMGVRVWLPESKKWADHWTSAGNGVVNAAQLGHFVDGDGVFVTEAEMDGIQWQYRGVWDQITSESCRWHQSASQDGGISWEWNWWMEWARQS
ncbi:MAG: hypothetical protein AB8B96_19705 [Lysobacterales bacterium]